MASFSRGRLRRVTQKRKAAHGPPSKIDVQKVTSLPAPKKKNSRGMILANPTKRNND
jgi:hypothetical protein